MNKNECPKNRAKKKHDIEIKIDKIKTSSKIVCHSDFYLYLKERLKD